MVGSVQRGPFVVCTTLLRRSPVRREARRVATPRIYLLRATKSAVSARRRRRSQNRRSSPRRRDRDEHGHHRVGEAGVPGGGPQPGLHQGGRQLLGARLRPPHHHLRRLRHRRLPLRDQARDPRAVDGDRRAYRGHGRVHVRLSELRRPPHGLLPQRRRGRALQE